MKKTFYTELAYVSGVSTLALGTALMEHGGFGVSMVVAPAYLLHLKLSQTLPFFTFGMAEYCLQLVLLICLSLALRRFKKGYLFSFATAFLYGQMLDLFIRVIGHIPTESLPVCIGLYLAGIVVCSLGVALVLHTYFAPAAYELAVKEIALTAGKKVSRVKTVYDLASLGVSILLSFCFYGFPHFVGMGVGTVVTALVNGWLVGRFCGLLEGKYDFRDRFPLRKFFEG